MRFGWFVSSMVLAVLVVVCAYWQKSVSQKSVEPSGSGNQAVTDAKDGAPVDDGKPALTLKMTWPEEGVADFRFTDRSGEEVSKNDLLGSPWVASFVFIQCAGPCPRVTSAVKELHDFFEGQNVKFVTFTVDPKRDTVEALKKYADSFGADPSRWYFLTGDRDELYKLIQTSFLMPVSEDPNPEPGWEIIHTTNVCLVDSTGRVVGKFNSTKTQDMVKLRKELKRMTESPLGSIPVKTDSSEGVN